MDRLIEDLFKKKDKDYVTLTNHYLEKINQNVKTRNGKMVTEREMNKIYQEGGFYHYLGTQNDAQHHELIPDGINNTVTPTFVLQSRDAPGIYGFGNDSGADIISKNIVNNEATGDSPTLSYGINNSNCAGTSGADSELKAAQDVLVKAQNENNKLSDQNSQTALAEAQIAYNALKGNSQCASTSECTRSYQVKEPPKTIFSKMWGYLNDEYVSNTSNAVNNVAKSCAPKQTGGGKPEKKILDKEFNKLMSNAQFKMPKYQKIQFKSFIEHLINQ